MSIEDRTTHGPEHVGDAIAAAARAVAGRVAGDAPGATWWTQADSREWRQVRRYFVEAYGCLSDEDVRRDPFTFDQALRETLVCRGCQARAGSPPGMDSGHADCPLAPTPSDCGMPMHPGGTARWFLFVRPLGEGRCEWRKRRCESRQARQNDIAEREGRMRDIGGGMRGVEVER
jgi:hypothetical protein